MNDRFQIRRWPIGCPSLVGTLAVVDTKNMDRIVKNYSVGDVLGDAKRDADKWNATAPVLCPVWKPMPLLKTRNRDGTETLSVSHINRADDRIYYDITSLKSLYADFEYSGL